MRILGPPSADYDTVLANVARRDDATELFITELLPALWAAAVRYGVDPVVLVALSFKETGGGSFKRLVTPLMYNPGGLKLRHPGVMPNSRGETQEAHSQFVSWAHGCDALAQHARCYTGTLDLSGRSFLVTDPRAWVVTALGYVVETVEELSGKWAPSPTYGQEIVELALELSEVA